MPTNVDEFAAEVTKFVRTRPQEDMNDLLRAVTFDLLEGLVLITPVDTGFARGNWQVSVGAEIAETVDRFNNPIGVEFAKVASLPDFPIIFVQNNAEYIEFLNEGSSPQANAGFFELQFATTSAKFAEAA